MTTHPSLIPSSLPPDWVLTDSQRTFWSSHSIKHGGSADVQPAQVEIEHDDMTALRMV
jgi:hypothetical protein